MPAPVPVALRKRVVALYIPRIVTYEMLAGFFDIGRATVSRILRLHRETGSVEPKPASGGQSPIFDETDRRELRLMVDTDPDSTLEELAVAWSSAHLEKPASAVTIWRELVTMGYTWEKALRAREVDEAAVVREREQFLAWLQEQDPTRVKFLDESGSHIAMTPLRGRAPSGQRLNEAVPRNRGTITTMIAAIGLKGMFALMTIEGGTSGDVFTAYVTEILVPTLKPGDIVVADNLAAHKVPAARAAIEAVGASLYFQPRYSPDLNPIELAWSKVKQAMRRMEPRAIEELDRAFVAAAGQVTAEDARAWFDHCASRSAQWS